MDESVVRRRFKAVLDRLGIRAAYEAMPTYLREQVFALRAPAPALRFDPSVPNDPEHARLREKLEAAFRVATFEYLCEHEWDYRDLSVRDYWSFVPALDCFVRSVSEQMRAEAGAVNPLGSYEGKKFARFPAIGTFCETAAPILAASVAARNESYLALHEAVVVPLRERGRLDGRLLYAGFSTTPGSRAVNQLVMTVKSESPQAIDVSLDGHARTAYRVGTNNEWDRIFWLSIDGGAIDSRWNGRELGVYAQSHALRQLHARVNVPALEKYADYWLYASLKELKVVERQKGGDLLIEYRIAEHRLGYLVATPIDDKLIVRTFLFLTMQPTPESRLLEKKLKLTRHEADWLGLTELRAFTSTDLRSDPTLRPMLESCGCGHLLALADEEWAADAFAPKPKPLAEEVKKYLRLAA